MKRQPIMTTNPHGATVKVCCASCEHKMWRADCQRWCKKRRSKVTAQNYCRRWRMSKLMEQAGSTQGRVKRHEYLMYVLEVREAEITAEEQGQQVEVKTIEEIRQLFEQEHGSIYIN